MEVFVPEPFEVSTEAVGHYWGTAFAYELVDSRWAEDEDPQWLLRGVRADSLGGLPVALRIPFGGLRSGRPCAGSSWCVSPCSAVNRLSMVFVTDCGAYSIQGDLGLPLTAPS